MSKLDALTFQKRTQLGEGLVFWLASPTFDHYPVVRLPAEVFSDVVNNDCSVQSSAEERDVLHQLSVLHDGVISVEPVADRFLLIQAVEHPIRVLNCQKENRELTSLVAAVKMTISQKSASSSRNLRAKGLIRNYPSLPSFSLKWTSVSSKSKTIVYFLSLRSGGRYVWTFSLASRILLRGDCLGEGFFCFRFFAESDASWLFAEVCES